MVALLAGAATTIYTFIAIGFAGFGWFNIIGTVALFFVWYQTAFARANVRMWREFLMIPDSNILSIIHKVQPDTANFHRQRYVLHSYWQLQVIHRKHPCVRYR